MTKTKTPLLLDALFTNLPLSILGEWIAATLYVQFVYLEQGIFIKNWYIFQCLGLLVQLYVPLSYRFKRFKLPFNYLVLYIGTLCITFISMPMLAIFYTYSNVHLIILIGAIYVAITAGASIFHCYIKYVHVAHVCFMFVTFTLVCFFKGDVFFYIGIGSAIYAIVMIIASIKINRYLVDSFNLSFEKEKRIENLVQYRTLLIKNNEALHLEHQKQKIVESDLLKANDELITNDKHIQLQNENRKNIFSLIYKTIDDIIIKTNMAGEIIQYNDKFINFFHIETPEALQSFSKTFLAQIPPEHNIHRYFPFSTIKLNKALSIELPGNIHLKLSLQIIQGKSAPENIWIMTDISQKVSQENMLFKMTHYDELTNLPNRKSLTETIIKYKEYADNHNKLFALAFIDINDFKIINDTQGHHLGNEILKTFANRLIGHIRPCDFAGRLGGDEFICIFSDLDYKADIDPIISRLKSLLEEPMRLEDKHFIINASFGVSYYPCDTDSIDELISYADIAMYKAKDNQKAIYERFLPQYTQHIQELHAMGQSLKTSLINNMFYLAFQPIYDAQDFNITKVEVLLRWKENFAPNIFIPLTEKLGLIQDIGLWVIKESCNARAALEHECKTAIKFSINISAKQIQTAHSIQKIMNAINCPHEWLEFEINESALLNLDSVMMFLAQLKKNHITVALDNFGTGFSSLSYLKKLHFDTIKIDKEFIEHIFESQHEFNIAKGIIQMAHKLKSSITIEGVETKAQLDFCIENNCHTVQGFYLSKPVDFDALKTKLKQKSTINASSLDEQL